MATDALPEGWEILRGWLPKDLNERAIRYGFFQRARGMQDAECWLRLVLMHVAGGLSLEQTVVRARELGLADLSAVALFKRLRRAELWLGNLSRYLLKESRRWSGRKRWPWKFRLRVIDATDVQEPGSTGTSWRIHYSVRLPEMTCDYYELTDDHGGEKLGRFQFAADELVLADRGYSHRPGVAQVIDAGAQIVFRWHPRVFPLAEESLKPFRPLPKLKALRLNDVAEWKVCFTHEGRSYPLRLCALRKGRLAAERARRKVMRKAQKNGTTPKADTLELAEFVLVLTSLRPEQLTARSALELYRCRWQIELVFKRLKSLLAAGHVPKSDDASAKAWMQAKILTAMLIERAILEGRFFSPWGYAG